MRHLIYLFLFGMLAGCSLNSKKQGVAYIYAFGQLQAVPYKVVKGEAVYGDMILGSVEAVEERNRKIQRSVHRQAFQAEGTHVWPQGKIPYEVDTVDETFVKHLNEAIAEYADTTGVVFYPRQDERDYVDFKLDTTRSPRAPESRAPFGKQSGASNAYIARQDIANRYVYTHQLGHIVGLHHEHQRPDRDDYVKVDWDLLRRDKIDVNTFDKLKGKALTRYDYLSVMHYPELFFSYPAKGIIAHSSKVLKSYESALSPLDRAGIHWMYPHYSDAVLLDLTKQNQLIYQSSNEQIYSSVTELGDWSLPAHVGNELRSDMSLKKLRGAYVESTREENYFFSLTDRNRLLVQVSKVSTRPRLSFSKKYREIRKLSQENILDFDVAHDFMGDEVRLLFTADQKLWFSGNISNLIWNDAPATIVPKNVGERVALFSLGNDDWLAFFISTAPRSLYMIQYKDGNWGAAEKVPLTTNILRFSLIVEGDERHLFFVNGERTKLYYQEYKNGKWEEREGIDTSDQPSYYKLKALSYGGRISLMYKNHKSRLALVRKTDQKWQSKEISNLPGIWLFDAEVPTIDTDPTVRSAPVVVWTPKTKGAMPCIYVSRITEDKADVKTLHGQKCEYDDEIRNAERRQEEESKQDDQWGKDNHVTPSSPPSPSPVPCESRSGVQNCLNGDGLCGYDDEFSRCYSLTTKKPPAIGEGWEPDF